jgi:Sulfotransferase family
MFIKPDLPDSGDPVSRLWLNARLWPGGPSSPLRSVFTICGSPRSGTTWLHNILIESGRFRGIPANDLENVAADPFLTDENRFIHLSLMQGFLPNSDPHLSTLAFKAICNLIYLRFGVSGELLLKSPYYCFFIHAMFASGICSKFVYMRRNPDFIALSMIEHPHIGRLLREGYEKSHDVIAGSLNAETRHVEQSLLKYVIKNYARLSLFDRALFKVLSFATSFAANSRTVPNEKIFIFDHDTFRSDPLQMAQFRQFVKLNAKQDAMIEGSFHPSPGRQVNLPKHDPAFRNALLEAERSLWSGT